VQWDSKDPSPAAPTNEHEVEVLNMNMPAGVSYFVLALAWDAFAVIGSREAVVWARKWLVHVLTHF